MARFYAGQPVICVNDDFTSTIRKYPSLAHGITWPVRGQRYVVRGYVLEKSKYPAIVLMEISNRRVLYADGSVREAGFWDERFEPATENQVQAIIAMAEDNPYGIKVPEWIPTKREREDA